MLEASFFSTFLACDFPKGVIEPRVVQLLRGVFFFKCPKHPNANHDYKNPYPYPASTRSKNFVPKKMSVKKRMTLKLIRVRIIYKKSLFSILDPRSQFQMMRQRLLGAIALKLTPSAFFCLAFPVCAMLAAPGARHPRAHAEAGGVFDIPRKPRVPEAHSGTDWLG